MMMVAAIHHILVLVVAMGGVGSVQSEQADIRRIVRIPMADRFEGNRV